MMTGHPPSLTTSFHASLSSVSPSTTSSSTTHPHRQWHPVYCVSDATRTNTITHTQKDIFFCANVCLSLFFSHTSDALLSVLEFYILMKEEARQPIREAGAGADHRGSDSRGVRGRLGGPPARPAARRPRVSWWQVVRPSGQDKSPLLWLWSPPPPPPRSDSVRV